jgi:hypothetical protein
MLLSACASDAQRQEFYLADGQQRHVPLLIYATSWNYHGSSYGITAPIPMEVSLINTQKLTIRSVTLTVGGIIDLCGPNLSIARFETEVNPVELGGPILPSQVYQAQPAWPNPDQNSAATMPTIRGCTTHHLVIDAVSIVDEAGVETVYRGRDVKKLLTSNISN